MQGGHQPLGVLWRPQQMGGLDQPAEFRGWNKRNVSRPFAANDDRFLPIDDLIQYGGEVIAEGRIGNVNWRAPLE